MPDFELVIIGAGVVGCAIARQLSPRFGDELIVLEQSEQIPAENQSSRNSGVLHAGIYYDQSKQPLKAKFCVAGNQMLQDYCLSKDIPLKVTGKILVATSEKQWEYLEDTARIARENGVKFDWLATQAEIAALEPNVVGNKALSFPSSGILDPIQLLLTLKNDAELAGATFLAGRKVIAMENRQREIFLKIAGNDGEETISCRYLINCAGLNADKLANLVNNENKWQLNPVRGEAACFSKTSRNNLLMAGLNVYPAPAVYDADTGEVLDVSLTEAKQLLKIGKAVKTVGVHLTPTFSLLDGKWQIGNMVTIGPEKNIVSNVTDLHTNLKSAEVFLQRVKPFFPELKIEDLTLHQAGIAASIRGEADFIIQKDRKCQNCIQLVGIDSPGLTSCLAIAEYVAELLEIEENLK